MDSSRPYRIGLIGAGRMAGAIVAGLLRTGTIPPDGIACTCGDDQTGPDLSARTGIIHLPDFEDLAAAADTLILACKPQQLNTLPPSLAVLSRGSLVLSILAGTPLSTLVTRCPEARAVVRSMPNTPGQIGAGITAWAPGSPLSSKDRSAVEAILGSLGEVVEVPESQLDAVTAVSGSGPAYLFAFTEAL